MEIQNAWYRFSIKALIYNKKGDFLLSKEESGLWDFPGGGLDHGEKYDECLKRELQEEMGLEIISIGKNPKYFITAYKPESKTKPWLANIFYEVKVKNLNYESSDECIEIGFFNLDSVENIETIVNVKEFIKMLKNN